MNLSGITGTIYYVSNNGSDTKDGKTPGTALATLGRVCDAGYSEFRPGDAVLFQSGCLWWGMLRCAWGVAYSAYGEGVKPKLCGSLENGANPDFWTLWYD